MPPSVIGLKFVYLSEPLFQCRANFWSVSASRKKPSPGSGALDVDLSANLISGRYLFSLVILPSTSTKTSKTAKALRKATEYGME